MRRAIFGVLILLLAAAGTASAGPAQDGVRAFNRQDYARAARVFVPLATRGDAQAQAYLGFMYAQGYGVPQSYVKAAYWYRRAAEQGNATAQYWLALMYDKGHGVPPDVIQAYKWLNSRSRERRRAASASRGCRSAMRSPLRWTVLRSPKASGSRSCGGPSANGRAIGFTADSTRASLRARQARSPKGGGGGASGASHSGMRGRPGTARRTAVAIASTINRSCRPGFTWVSLISICWRSRAPISCSNIA